MIQLFSHAKTQSRKDKKLQLKMKLRRSLLLWRSTFAEGWDLVCANKL